MELPKLKPWEWGIAAVAGLGITYLAWKQHAANSSASTAATASGTDPLTGMPYSEDNQVDPATGMTYLDEAQEYGSVSAAEESVSSYGTSDYYGNGTPVLGYTGEGYDNYDYYTGTGAETYASNAQWSQAVQAGLTDIGYSSTDVSGALGRYLAGLSLTTAQAGIVQAAIAEYGPPPVGTFQIITQSPVPTGGTGAEMVKVPDLFGYEQVNAINTLKAVGLHPSYSAPPKGKTFYVDRTVPAAGTSVKKGTEVRLYSEQKQYLPKKK